MFMKITDKKTPHNHFFSIPVSAKHQEIWDVISTLENHKSQIADCDLGAGIYIDYYILKNSMQEESAIDDSVRTCSLEVHLS
jgi:hypothetical protein